MSCRECGAELQDGVCTGCGASFRPAPHAPVAPEPAKPTRHVHLRSRPSPKRLRDPERAWYLWPTLWVHWALVLLALVLMWRTRHSPWLFMLSVVPLLVDAFVAPSALRPMALAAMHHRALGGMLGTWVFLVGLAAIAAAIGFVAAAFSFWALGVGALLVAYGVTSCWVGVQLVGRAPEDLEDEPIFRRLSGD